MDGDINTVRQHICLRRPELYWTVDVIPIPEEDGCRRVDAEGSSVACWQYGELEIQVWVFEDSVDECRDEVNCVLTSDCRQLQARV